MSGKGGGTMVAQFEDGGIRFKYPENWTPTDLEKDHQEARLQIVVTKTQGGRQTLIGGN